MAAKKDKSGIDALRNDIQALQESFWRFRDAMLTDAALEQAEQQQTQLAIEDIGLASVSEADVNTAAGLMAAIGHPQRLRMAMMLAENPISVTEVVEKLGLSTTGAAYHHLKALMNAGLVEQPRRGTFAFTADALPRVQQLLAGLFGLEADPEKKSSKKKNKS